MKASATKAGLTLRVIAGTNNAILGIDLQENMRAGCFGFSIQRTDVEQKRGRAETGTQLASRNRDAARINN